MAALVGCNGDTLSRDRFGENGRIIALSGAGAGAANACFTPARKVSAMLS